MSRIEEIIKKAKIISNDVSGRRFTDDAWITFLNEALVNLNREFKFKFKRETIAVVIYPTPNLLPADFLVIKSVYVGDNQAYKTSYDELSEKKRFPIPYAYYYAIEGNYIYTNFSGTCDVVYYSSSITIDDVPSVFDNLIVDYLVLMFFKANYPELEEHYYGIYERNKFKLRQDILNLETKTL